MTIKRAARCGHGEKKCYMNNSVTPTAQAGLDKLAHDMGLSRSEFLEQIGRGILQVVIPGQ